MSLLASLCLWTACSTPRHAQVGSTLPYHGDAITSVADQAPQAAQGNPGADLPQTAEEPVLLASSEPAALATANQELDQSLKALAAERPQMARKLGNAVRQAQNSDGKPAAGTKMAKATKSLRKVLTKAENKFDLKKAAGTKMAKATKSLRKVLTKAENKFDLKKAEGEKAAQANASLVAVGALLAVGGLVLLLVTSGTASTIGLIALVVGLVVLLVSLLT